MEVSHVLYRAGFESRIFLERADKFGTTTFDPPVVAMTKESEAGVPGHAHWFHILG